MGSAAQGGTLKELDLAPTEGAEPHTVLGIPWGPRLPLELCFRELCFQVCPIPSSPQGVTVTDDWGQSLPGGSSFP